MEILDILKKAVAMNASDVFIIAGKAISYKVNNQIRQEDDERLSPGDTQELINAMYSLAQERDRSVLMSSGDDDFAFSVPGLSRFRLSVYRQRSSLAAVIRVISFELPNPKEIGIPRSVIDL
ncbi:MAG: type IV pili twitching motility protein PilT, partial [Bacillota bacterium]|nr:type IV pili twitching motility protein PilT [Bacillota bacterium]